MKDTTREIYRRLLEEIPALKACSEDVEKAYNLMKQCYMQGGKVLICGNGGSAADSEHIVGELMKGFLLKRKICREDEEKLKAAFKEEGNYLAANLQGALPAISLVSQAAISTAFINDVAADMVFAQQVYGYGKAGDVLIGLSTSGNSKNVVNAVKVAETFGLKTIGMTGESGGAMKDLCDVCIRVPATATYKVQEYHLPVYHALCAMIETDFFEG
jgi:D-sedoheptulose 7-phosphate isomerase